MPNGLPPIKQEFFPLKGGLDLVTPQIVLGAGMCFDAQNYEPEISGGYSRIAGYERYDGRLAPSSVSYWLLTATITGTLAIGNTITGLTSTATGKILAIVGTSLILGRVTGTFLTSEALQVAAVTQATSTSTAQLSGSTDPSSDADYTLLAANDRRLDISVVPGSGQIRGVAVYRDVVYAFRDNAGGTAGNMYKATAGGWVQVGFGTEIQFSSATGGTAPIAIGDTIANLGAAPTKTATVVAVLTRKGTWGTDAVGTLIITPVTGSFSNADTLFVGATQKAVSTTAATAIARLPGGRITYINANFTGSTDTLKMYGSDGVNLAFEFDGTNYIPIRTGMAADTPVHCMFHRFYLFLSFKGSVQFSAIGNPYAWTVVLGAGEIGLSEDVTGFVPQGGNVNGSSLGIFARNKVFILYGSAATGSQAFNLVLSNFELGYAAYTMQAVSNNTYGLTGRGIQSLITTLTYGDFDFASVSHLIQPLVTSRRGTETASTSSRTRDQYRLYYADGTGIAMGITADSPSGLMPLNYGKVVRVITTVTLNTGPEVTYFGSDDGYIYQDNVGTSFDGGAIEAWVRPAFNHSKSPMTRKRYRRAIHQIKPYGYSKLDIGYDLGYGNPDLMVPVQQTNNALLGGGYWDQFTWDQFSWDAKTFNEVSMSLTGTEKNIGFLYYSNRAQDSRHTLQGCTLLFTPQRNES